VLVIQSGTVLTVDGQDTVHFGGHVVIDGDRIAAVGAGRYDPGRTTR
jgi:5-methylthioadenosine/S-adenosylhomocysteine deaminase